jgi:large subunit ribosomal protein L5|uniref:Ribosomal protein L5 n=1 Tax=Thalassiosira pseudonana TaxID=35128 RepID=Q3S292_THAPS|nr:ribosomal protein L5 [Thalassiosira pseudonana]AAZ99412.1 ribosomal protein L5 [Thalassiosira pseudonana]QWM92932.1 ribosomal protein L5 [Thalassiosira pseudonana]
MFFFNSYLNNVVKHDLINKFFYTNLKQIPKLETIVLNFGYQNSNFKHLISGLLALELLSSKKSRLTRSKHLNVFLKIKKGNPVGCKIVLKKTTMHVFYLKLITSVFPKIKHNKTAQSQQNVKSVKSISIIIKNPLLFLELESQYQFFKDIPKLDITILTDSKSQNEIFFLLKSVKFFI